MPSRPTSDQSNLSGVTPAQQVLRNVSGAAAAVQRLADLEYSGRVMATFMRGHMLEIQEMMAVPAYMARFYDDVAQEYIQLDDEDFTIHHCLRTLFYEWRCEGQALDAGDFGEALRSIVPNYSFVPNPVVPTSREPIADEWYREVADSLMDGKVPEQHGVRNPIMRGAECVLDQRTDLIFAQFMIWCGRVWGRQLIVTWELLRQLIGLHRTVRELSASKLAQIVEKHSDSLRNALATYRQLIDDWASFHSETVTTAHDPLYAEQYTATRAWRNSKPQHDSWRIKDAMRGEMYLEVFVNVQAMRDGRGAKPLPEFSYWRQTPWTPASIRPGAPGMPPFVR